MSIKYPSLHRGRLVHALEPRGRVVVRLREVDGAARGLEQVLARLPRDLLQRPLVVRRQITLIPLMMMVVVAARARPVVGRRLGGRCEGRHQ